MATIHLSAALNLISLLIFPILSILKQQKNDKYWFLIGIKCFNIMHKVLVKWQFTLSIYWLKSSQNLKWLEKRGVWGEKNSLRQEGGKNTSTL